MHRNRIAPHWLAFIACSSLMGGLLLAKYGIVPIPTLAMAGLLWLPLLSRLKFASVVPIAAIFLSLGLMRGGHIHGQLEHAHRFIGENVHVAGRVSTDPVYHESGQLEFRITDAKINDAAFPGNIRVRGFTADILRGDIVEIEAKLYDGFGPLSGSMSYGDIKILNRSNSPLEKLRREFMADINTNMAEPESSLGLGFLLGSRSILPESLTAALSATGLTHIVAVSGYNLTIIVDIIRRLFAKRSRFISLAASLGLLFSFIAIAGSVPSVNRAAVVSIMSLVAWYFGRQAHPLVLLWLSATVTAYWQPLYIWGDIGWYLSFCAFFGVLVLAPLVSKKLYKKRKPGLLGSIFVETTMAQLATLPLIILIFKDVSLVSLLANMLVLPLIPIVMLLTFISGLAGMLLPPIAAWLSWPAYMLLSYIVNLINLLARLPWAEQSIAITSVQFIVIWLVIFLVWQGLAKGSRLARQREGDYQTL